LGAAASIGVFMVWGMGVHVASVSYLSLVSELSENAPMWRSRAVSIMWTAMILSTIATSLLLSRMLAPYSVEALYTAFGMVWLLSTLMILFGAANLERVGYKETHLRRHTADNPLTAFRIVSGNPTAKRFFFYLLLVLISIHAQDVLLEPFGAEALNMPVAMTSRLTAIWGMGLFVTLIGGLPLVRRLGKKPCANLGAWTAAAAFTLIIFTGLAKLSALFMGAIFLLGLGGGLMTVSNLSFMLDMTVPQAAGLYMGAWGAANFAGQALGNIASGLLRDLLYRVTGDVLLGYATVFGLEVLGLLAAVWLFRHISVEEFRRDAQLQIHEVLSIAGN
jgi:MFS transporter, BCD family, chlorophyll transporter